MDDGDVIDLEMVRLSSKNKHEQRGFFSLRGLPQRLPVEGHAKGTGWWELDQIFKIYPGQFTVVSGIPGHGKSTFLLNLICNLACEHGTNSFLYVPENEAYLRENMRGIWGDRGNMAAFDFFCEHRVFVQTAQPDDYDQQPQDLPWVLDKAIVAIEKEGVDLLLIDPWNELEHAKPHAMPMTDYIRHCLMYLKQFARKYSVSVILVAHPTKAVFEHGGRTATLYDVEGSAAWANKCDNGLIVVRDYDTKATRVISAKVRERGAGKIGVCYFHVDENTGRFTPQHGAVSL